MNNAPPTTDDRRRSPFADAIDQNTRGELSSAQKRALAQMFRARFFTSVLLMLCAGFVGSVILVAFIAGETYAPVLQLSLILVMSLALLCVLYCGAMLVSNMRAKHRACVGHVEKRDSFAVKHEYTTPVHVPAPGGTSALHTIRVHSGWINLGGDFCGVLPSSLYDAILNRERGIFYYVFAGGIGYKPYIIVNYQASGAPAAQQ